MKKRMKRFLCLVLVFSMIFSNTVYAANEEEASGQEQNELVYEGDVLEESLVEIPEEVQTEAKPEEMPEGEVVTAEAVISPEEITEIQELYFEYAVEESGSSNEELFDAYAEREFKKGLGEDVVNISSTSILDDLAVEKELYNAIKEELAKVAAGTVTSTEITVSPAAKWSRDDLGVDSFVEGGAFTEEATAAVFERFGLIYTCLLADCPLELYWHDKTDETGGVEYGLSNASIDGSGNLKLGNVCFKFAVSKDYSASDSDKTYVTDAAKTSATTTAVANAKAIAAEHASKGDKEKLTAYKNEICELVSYDHYAAGKGHVAAGMDHWQLVYVFDNDEDTNVVCEGYSKAFQYLCDLSEFSDDIECHTVYGTMMVGSDNEAHMWNVVTNGAGKNYLVDVTNCDSGSIGAPDKLFMAAADDSADEYMVHTFVLNGTDAVYTYDTMMQDLFCEGYPAIADAANEEVVVNVYKGAIDTFEFSGDASGAGWTWDHETRTLTLTNAVIDLRECDDWFGIYLREGSTLVSAGRENRIIGNPGNTWDCIETYGNLIITGSAPLILEGADYGIFGDYEFKNLTIDGTPISIKGNYGTIQILMAGAADHALTLKGGSYIATPGIEIAKLEGEEYYTAYRGDEIALELEIAVAENYIEPVTIPKALYVGKSDDSTMSIAMNAEAGATTGTVSYQWYSCDDYEHTNPVAIEGAVNASYIFSGSKSAGEYYFFCQATAGSLSINFPVSKVVLNSFGKVPYVGELYLDYDSPEKDMLNSYGWKWDPAAMTLTLDNANITGELNLFGDPENLKDITVKLTPGSINNISHTTYYHTLRAHSNENRDFIIKGAGTLNVNRINNTTKNYDYGVVQHAGNYLVVEDGAQVNLYNSGYIKMGAVLSPKLQVKDTAKLTVINNTEGVNVTDINYAVGTYQELVATEITTPEDYTTELKNGYNYIKDASGYATTVVFEASSEPYYKLTVHPAPTIQVKSDDDATTFTLTAAATANNGAPAPSYQWYKCSYDGSNAQAIEGAASSSYTQTGKLDFGAYYYFVTVSGEGVESVSSAVSSIYASPNADAYFDSYAVKTSVNDEYSPLEPVGGISVALDTEVNNWNIGLNKATVFASANGLYLRSKNNANITVTGENYIYSIGDVFSSAGQIITFDGSGSLDLCGEQGWFNASSSQVIIKDDVKLSAELPVGQVSVGSLIMYDDAEVTFNTTSGIYIADAANCDFIVEGEEGAYIKGNNGGYLTDADGNKILSGTLKADPTVRLVFETYPTLEIKSGKGKDVLLTTEAVLTNYGNTQPAISYQWYKDGKVIAGATSAKYTFKSSEPVGIYVLRCDAKVTAGGTTYSITGNDITLKYGCYGERLLLNYNTASVDRMDDYGWKWDKDTATLTLDGAFIDGGSYSIYINSGFTKEVTIQLAEGSHNVAYGSTSGYPLITYSDLKITGNGTLELIGKNTSLVAQSSAAPVVTVAGGAHVLINDKSAGNVPMKFYNDSKLKIQDKNSKVTINVNDPSKDPLTIPYLTGTIKPPALNSYFVITTPENGYIRGGYIYDADGRQYKGSAVLAADAFARISFTTYPQLTQSVAVGGSVKLTAAAKALYFTEANPTLTYTWYKEDGTKLGTGATYTYKASKGIHKIYCVVSGKEDGETISMKGDLITVAGGVITERQWNGVFNESFDQMSEYGWKWDVKTKTLTLENFQSTGAVYLPADSTIYVTPGSTNKISVVNDYAIYGICTSSVQKLTIKGSGKLTLEQSLTSGSYNVLDVSVGDLYLTGVNLEVIRNTNHSNTLLRADDIYYTGATVSIKGKTGSASDLDLTTDSGNLNATKLTLGSFSNGTRGKIYGVLNSETGYVEAKLEPDGFYLADASDKIVTISEGETAALSVKAVSTRSGKISYQWYKTEDYSSPEGDPTTKPIAGATNSTLSVKATERGMQGYYFCKITSGDETITGPVSAVIAGAKGKLPVTEAITTDKDYDYLSTHGWKWDNTTKTLTLSDVEVYIPFASEPNWITLADGYTVKVTEGSDNRVGNEHYIDIKNDSRLLFTGNGNLEMVNIYQGHLVDATFTDGFKLHGMFFHSSRGSRLTVKNGADVRFTEGDHNSYFNGHIEVEDANLEFYVLSNNDTEGSVVVKNGGTLFVHRWMHNYGPVATVEAGGTMKVFGAFTLGTSSSGGYVPASLTVGGTLLLNAQVTPLNIYTTLSGAEAFKLTDGAKVHTPEAYVLRNGEAEGEKRIILGVGDDNYSGTLFIGPSDFQPTPLKSIKLVGTPKYGERLDFITDPADVIIEEYELETSYSKDGPWSPWSVGSSNYQDVSTALVDRYLRVTATGTGTHSGTVTSTVVGPVVGDPATLKALYIDDGGWAQNNFYGNTYSYGRSLSVSGLEEEYTERFWAVPVNENAKISMVLVNSKYPDGLRFEGDVADIPMVLGKNTVTITVSYGGVVNEYEITNNASIGHDSFGLVNYIGYSDDGNDNNDTIVTAVLDYADPSRADETIVNEGNSSYSYIPNVPYDTKITLTTDASEGKRIWKYSGELEAADDGNGTFTYVLGEYPYDIRVGSEYLIAIAPEVTEAVWKSSVENDGTSDAIVGVKPLKNSRAGAGEYGYYNIRLEVCDADGNIVSTYNTAEYEAVPDENGVILCALRGLVPSEDYTICVYYSELLNTYSGVPKDIQCATLLLEGVPENVELIPETDYIVLSPGGTAEITFDFDGLRDSYIKAVESSDEDVIDPLNDIRFAIDDYKKAIISVPEDAKEGTAWLTFGGVVQVYGEGARTAYATVRVDVSTQEETPQLNLGITSGNINVYDGSEIIVPVYQMDSRYQIVSAEFVTPDQPEKADAINAKFEIQVVNDRTLRVVPIVPADSDTMNWSSWASGMKGTYTAAIRVNYKEGTDGGGNPITMYNYVSPEKLTMKVTAKAPSVKVSAVKLNSFYQNDTKNIVYTIKNETVKEAKIDAVKTTSKVKACPDWLTLSEDGKSVTIDSKQIAALKNKASGKLYLKVWIEGWRAPAQITASVSVASTTPKVKLSNTTVNLPKFKDNISGYDMQLLSSDKKVAYDTLNITGLRVASRMDLALMSAKDRKTYNASNTLNVNNFNPEDGTFLLVATETPVAGKALLIATVGDNSKQEIKLPITVKIVEKPVLKASTTSFTLNTALSIYSNYRDEKVVTFSTSANGYKITNGNTNYKVTDSTGKIDLTDELGLDEDNGKVTIYPVEKTVEGKTYKVHVTVEGIEKPAVITVKAKATLPKLKLSKTSLTMSRAWGSSTAAQMVTVASGDKNYDANIRYAEILVTNPDGKIMGQDGSPNDTLRYFVISESNQQYINISLGQNCVTGKYKVSINHVLPSGLITKAVINVTVNDKLPTVKLSKSSVSLYPGITAIYNDEMHGGTYHYNEAEVGVKGLEDVAINSFEHTVKDSKGKDAYSAVAVSKNSTKLNIWLTEDAVPGQTYKVSFWVNLQAINTKTGERLKTKAVTLTVKALKSISASGSVKGSIDLTRTKTTKADFSLKFTGWTPENYSGFDRPVLKWEVYAKDGKNPVTAEQGALGTGVYGDGLVAYGDSNTEGIGWFKNVADIDEAPYALSLMTSNSGKGLIKPAYKYTCRVWVEFPAAITSDGSDTLPMTVAFKELKFTVKQGTTKFSQSVKTVDLKKLDPYGRGYITVQSSDKDKQNVEKIAKLELQSSALADALELKPYYSTEGVKYTVQWKDMDPSIPGVQINSSVKSGTVKVKVFLEGNNPEWNKPNATLSLKVNIK